jgi:MFS family permease
MQMPWTALLVLFDPLLSPFILTCACSFAVMFCSLTTAPIYLAAGPYGLSAGLIGVTFLCFGGGALIGAAVGGTSCDASYRAFPECVQGRMVYALVAIPILALAGMLYAYSVQHGWSLAIVLVMEFFIGVSQSAILTACMVYLGEVRPKSAAAACAVMMCLCFCFAAICVASVVPALSSISLSTFYWIMVAVYLVMAVWWLVVVQRSIATARYQLVASSNSKFVDDVEIMSGCEQTVVVVADNDNDKCRETLKH